MTALLTIAWPLLRRYWQAVAIALLVALLVGACHQRDEGLKREGAMREQLAVLEQKHTRDSVTDIVRTTVVQADTQRLRKVMVTYDTVRSTLNLTDTVAVKVTLAAADTVIRQCRVTVDHLLSSCAAKDTLIGDLRNIIALRVSPAAAPGMSWKEKLFWAGVSGGLGALAHQAVIHPP